MPTTITRVNGNMFDLPVDLITVWLHRGFARIDLTWNAFLEKHHVRMFPSGNRVEAGSTCVPWLSRDALMSVEDRRESHLRWVYALNTQQDGLGYRSLSDVSDAVRRVLDTAHLLQLTTVGFMYIKYAPEGKQPTKALQNLAAATMVASIQGWGERNADVDMRVKLVDIDGGFIELGSLVADYQERS